VYPSRLHRIRSHAQWLSRTRSVRMPQSCHSCYHMRFVYTCRGHDESKISQTDHILLYSTKKKHISTCACLFLPPCRLAVPCPRLRSLRFKHVLKPHCPARLVYSTHTLPPLPARLLRPRSSPFEFPPTRPLPFTTVDGSCPCPAAAATDHAWPGLSPATGWTAWPWWPWWPLRPV